MTTSEDCTEEMDYVTERFYGTDQLKAYRKSVARECSVDYFSEVLHPEVK